ncbi:MAG: response regulator transcription factor [Chloroflexi bacterium]|nr:response regulator transcription factor [Chloroflexota bacterium]
MIRVLIVDDHMLMRQGVCALLMKAPEIKVVGEARDGKEAIERAAHLQPDVILMDIEMPRLDGLQATCQLTQDGSAARIIILSMRTDEKSVRRAADCGAHGYLIKNSGRADLIDAIRSVNGGQRVASPEVESYFFDAD